ncbi:type I-E CRISPR-associated protein Cas5/CasD [Apilactobacillus xinyiensis]|uniref:type I-E CRISPR-associated protein Cas5/CasD n=1 Tax=Apilactobacillus xinyiensis TaxID=2841032 RepID=UPI00200CE332|nr:type I-E CRISPR-associated protein Cas5/CasD [Apilactobacillus xinyiensis]MCL0319226.1 type I-E CRISPR-associated protein Cas5/CasD [Apilactobacillus xinyiensis]
MKTLLMKFSGPLQAFGTNSHYENRQTGRFPSKSAVIGMIAAAMGYRRYEDSKLKELNQLSFGVRVDQPGNILRDFQIAVSHKPNGERIRSYVTNRYYLQDAVFVVAIGSDNEDLIDRIRYSLKHPYFQLFLGRRSLPINNDFLIDEENYSGNDLITDLKDISWQAAPWYQKQCLKLDNKSVYICADSQLIDSDYSEMVRDIPESFSQGLNNSPDNHYDRRSYRLRSISFINNIDVKTTF